MKERSDKHERVIQALEKCVRKLREEKYFGKVAVIMQEGNIVHLQLNSDLTPVEFADKFHPRKLIMVTKKNRLFCKKKRRRKSIAQWARKMRSKMKTTWTKAIRNPVTGRTKISAGCHNCCAEGASKKLQAAGSERYRRGFEAALLLW